MAIVFGALKRDKTAHKISMMILRSLLSMMAMAAVGATTMSGAPAIKNINKAHGKRLDSISGVANSLRVL